MEIEDKFKIGQKISDIGDKTERLKFLDYVVSMRNDRYDEYQMYRIKKNEKILLKFINKLKQKRKRRINLERRSK
jgi:hypothetical protein